MKRLLFCLFLGLTSPLLPAITPALADNSSTLQNQNTLTAISQLEERYFGHSYGTDDTDYRLQRLENFTFGATHSGSPAQRISTLLGVINSQDPPAVQPSQPETSSGTNNQRTANAASGTKPTRNSPETSTTLPDRTNNDLSGQQNDNSTASSSSSAPGNYPHITTLEQEILGHTYETDGLQARLSRMEKTAFGTPSTDQDLSSRTDALENYTQKHLHKKSFFKDQSANDSDAADNNVPANNSRGGIRGLSYLGLGSAPNPWSSYQMSQAPVAPPSRPVDPDAAVAAQATPPSEHARMLSRVAWCEQHLFGRTYPELHLLERLHQLNANLFPNDHEKDIQLMDRLDIIVKEVVLRQHPPQQTATNSQTQ